MIPPVRRNSRYEEASRRTEKWFGEAVMVDVLFVQVVVERLYLLGQKALDLHPPGTDT